MALPGAVAASSYLPPYTIPQAPTIGQSIMYIQYDVRVPATIVMVYTGLEPYNLIDLQVVGDPLITLGVSHESIVRGGSSVNQVIISAWNFS